MKEFVTVPDAEVTEEQKTGVINDIETVDCEIENDICIPVWSLMPDQVELQENPLVRDKRVAIKKEIVDTLSKYNMLKEESEVLVDTFIDSIFSYNSSQPHVDYSHIR